MPENKRYLIEIPGLETGSGIWDADKWERNKEAFMADYPDANVFELGDYDPDDTNENDQFMLTFEDDPDSSGVWDAAKWERNKEAFTADNPEAKVSRVRYVDYWGEQATANRERRKALEQPDAERNARLAEIGYYDDLSYGQGEFNMDTDLGYGLKPLSSAIETNSVSGEATYLDPRVQEFFVNDTAETERQAEIARLDAEYESNPSVIRQREIEAQIAKEREEYIDKSLAEIRADIETEVDAIEAGKGAFQKTASAQGMGDAAIIQQAMDFMRGKDAGQAMVQNERMETYNSAIKLFEKARQAREVAGKGFWAATGDVAKDKLRDLATQSDIEMYNQIGGILTRLEDKLGSLDDVGEDVLEANLSKEEQALIKAFFEYNSAMSDAQQDMSKAYKGGKIFGESVGFMLEFLATGGLAGGTGKAASSGVGRALVKWASKAAKGTAKRAFRTGVTKAARGLSSAAVGTLARTVAAPGTYRNMAEQSVKIEDGHLDRTKNATKAFFDSYIENLSEISGGVIGKSLGMFGLNPSKLLGKVSFGKIGQLLADNRLAQGLSKGVKALFGEQGALTKLGFNGIFEEVEEEYIGNFIREVTGVQPGALAEMHKDGNFGAMLIGFAPMTLFGAGMSAANMAATNIEAANLGKKLRETLGQHYTEDAVSHMMNLVDNAENADEVWKAIEPMAGALNEEETTMLYQYGAFKAQNKAMLFARKAQERQLADAKRAEIQQDYGRFWQEGEDGAQSVQMADLNDGRRVFVLSAANEQGEIAVVDTKTGETGIANVADIKSVEQDGVSSPQTRTWSMDAFLDYTIALDRRSAEQTRMVNERDQQIEALKSGITEGMEINLGTEGSPVIMLATGQFTKDGVLAGDASGNIHTIGWEQVADALGTPIRVKTDQDLIDEETAAIAARRAERRKKAGSASQQLRAALDETAQQTAEVVSLEERHIPKNPDGSVNETAFWEQDPEGYAQWNDEQNKDGGADTMRQLAVSKMLLAGVLAEAQKATQTSNPAERKAAEQTVREIQDKIDRYTAIEQSYVERAMAPLRERAMKWNSLTGASVILVENEEQLAEISGEAARQSAGGARVRGFAKDGRAYIYLPGVQDAAEIDAVFVHEAVSHQGLKGLLGQKGFDELCEQVWQMMSPEMQNVFINYPGVNGNRLAAADEYIAHIAERIGTGVADETERTIWDKIVDFVRNILRAMGIEVGMNERELSDLLHMAYADLARNLSEAEKIAQQNADRKEAVGAAPTTARQMYDAYIKEGLTPEEVSQGVQNDFKAAKEAYDAKVAEKPTIKAGESTASFIERKKAYNEELGRLEQELRMQQALMDEIAKIQNTAMETAVEESPVAEEVLEDNGLDESVATGEDVRFNKKTKAPETAVQPMAGHSTVVSSADGANVIKNLETLLEEYRNKPSNRQKTFIGDLARALGLRNNGNHSNYGTFEAVNGEVFTYRISDHNSSAKNMEDAGSPNGISIVITHRPNGKITKDGNAHIVEYYYNTQKLLNADGKPYADIIQSVIQSLYSGEYNDTTGLAERDEAISFSIITHQMDADYLAAVERGDMKTAQRMVLEAAKLAMPNTKVVDKKGNPAVVHHGTKGKFNTFAYSREDIGFHFGTKGTARTRIGRGKDARIMQVFLNLENPLIFDTDLGSWDADYIVKDLFKKEMMSYDDAKAILLTPNGYKRNSVSALVDLRQWMSNNGYDGIVYPNWYESDGKESYIAFNRNQIKSADPVAYDDAGNVIPLSERFNPENEDIRFSTVRIDPNANQQAEGNVVFSTRRGSLVGMHNISEEKLRKVIKQGGSANPSTAVIDIERQAFDSYGEISLIMPLSLVDAETGRNAGTFTADAWTPTYPQIEKRFSVDELQRAYWRDITAIPEEMQHEVRMAFDSWLDNRTASGLAYMFLQERGEAPEMVRVAAKFPQEIKDKMSAILGEGRTGIYELTDEEKQAVLDLYIQENFGGSREDFDSSIAETIQRIEDRLSTGKVPSFVEKRITADLQWMKEHGYNYDNLSNFVRDIVSDIRHAGEVNAAATTNRALDYIKDNNLSAEYEQWKESLNDRYGIKEYLFDGYTPSGNPRWLPNTVENASKLMNKQGLAGATGMASSFNRFVATLAPKKKSLSDIRSSKGHLVEEEKLVDDFRDKWSKVFFDLGIKCQPDAKGYEDYGLERLTEAAQKKNPGAYLKKEYGVELSQEDLQRLADMINAIKTEFPARYFETKFQRPVYLNEFAAAVIPTTTSADIKQAIAEAGLPIFEYDSSADGARREATLKATDMEGVRFSVFEPHNATMDEIDNLFHDYNGDKSLEPLYDKVSALARTMDLKIRFDYPWSAAAGSTFGDKVKLNTEFFNSLAHKSQDKAHALLHEMIHATTNYAIAARNTGVLTEGMKEAVSQLEGIYGEIVNDSAFDGTYGARSVYEMVAELSNPEFRSLLKEKNLFQRIVAAIKRLLGIEVGENALDNLSATLDYMLDNYDGRVFGAVVNEYQKHDEYTRFSIANHNQAIFVSNAARAVEAIKMEKATPEQWLKMIEKNGGLKAGEDKWMGLSDWLKASKAKTLTKKEVLDFINENMIVIEETHYAENAEADAENTHAMIERILQEKFGNYIAEYYEQNNGEDDNLYGGDSYEYAMDKLREEMNDEFPYTIERSSSVVYLTFPYEEIDDLQEWADKLGVKFAPQNPINNTRLYYTTNGLQNNHEIALVVPAIEPWNETDGVHFGDAGNGRAVAWIRFGETWEQRPSPQISRKVLVIDEIQSKRHQEGREKGYMPNLEKEYEEKERIFLDAQDAYISYLKDTYNVSIGTASQSEIESLRANDAKLQDLWEVMQDANGDLKDVGRRQALQLSDARSVPDAPFDKNWHELAMKRMLRYAAEEGYDVIAWTKGEQQAERYNLGEVVDNVTASAWDSFAGWQDVKIVSAEPRYGSELQYVVDREGKIVADINDQYEGRNIAEVFGKEIAVKLLAEGEVNLSNAELRLGSEGMKGFYDRMLPAFMNKYGKKWGVKVEDIELPDVEEAGRVMHSVPVTEEMKASVMEGQVMFSVRNTPISPEVRAEMDVIAATAMVNGNYMLAPNGQPTKLTADQWAMVRTKNFINWFGDWINDPENASKVVDENGEPKVVYHGSNWRPALEKPGLAKFRMRSGLMGRGAYFTDNFTNAADYAREKYEWEHYKEVDEDFVYDNGYITEAFLNIRNEDNIREYYGETYYLATHPSQIKSATDNTGEFSESEDVRFSALTSEEYSEDGTRFSAVTDPMLVAQFESEPKIKVYRAMQLIDGKLYPPMSAYVDGVLREPSELGQWEQAEENTIGRNKKDPSKVDLEQGKGDDGKKRKTSGVLYNPYFHTSLTPLNDQFSGAQTRSNLVIVETEVPQSELTSGYQAEGAANSVGMVDWHSGPIAGVLAQYEGKGRQVILSRWAKPIRIVPESEIADITMKLFEGTTLLDVPLPSNVFTPALREELERRGMKFVETTNNGRLVSDRRRTWSKTYGKNGLAKRPNEDVRFSAVSTPVDDVIEDGLMLSVEDFARLAEDVFSVLPESVRNKVMEEAFRNGFDMQSAIFQIPARLAEKMGWDEADKELARAIRDKVQDAVDASGVATERPLTSKEAMWMLYNATQPVAYGDLIGESGKALAAHNLGFDPKSEALKEKTDAAIRYSTAGGRAIDAATDMYNYEANLWINRLAESWLDMHKSVIALQKALADASGKPIESWEDIVLALNQLSSKSYAGKKKYMRDFLKPLWDTVLDMVEKEYLSIEQIERYMMLKHGLERNDKLAKRDAREFYRAMYGLVAERMKSQSHAQQVVALSEAKKRLADIDAQIAAASSSQLSRLNEARARAQYDVDVADLVLRGDEQQNEADLQAHYDAIDNKVDPKYREFRKKDYGGLSGMFVDFDRSAVGKRSKYKTEEAYQAAVRAATKPKFNNVEDVELAAENEVAWFEKGRESQIKELWQKINAATKETLRHQHASGMITTEQYDAVRDMFEYYVPLRGFADNTAEDMYSYYMSNSAGGFAKPLIAAKGRKTKAESPLGWIGTMAESAIQQDNKNDVKMRLYYALLNRPDNGLLSMSETWYEYSHTDSVTGKKVFVPAFPPATGGVLSADQMRAHMDAWEAGMKAKQAAGQAYKASQKIDLKGSVIFQDIKEEKEHIIQVRVAGKEYSIIVNGNPRAAQAINGLLNPDAKHGPFRDAIGWVRRGMSSLMTSLSPLFWVSNYQRDILSSTMRTSLEYGWKEAWNYFNNRRKAWRVASYIYKYEEGTLGDSYYENLYKEFAENGGITGYTVLATNKEYEKMLEDYAKHVDQKVLNFIRNIWDKFMGFGEAIEQVSRFAAYITARESGKSIEEAVSAAKEVSVNFNRKGSASPISWDESGKLRKKNGNPLNRAERIFALILSAMPGAMKEMYFFFNASVQATSSTFQKARKSPGKTAAWAAFIFGTSLAVALINNMLADDDDEEYLDLPDYLRQSNILIPVGDGYYIKWSIPQEVRPFYSMADILVSKIKGKTPHKNAWQVGKEMGLTTMQWLPMNPFDAEDPILAFVPDWIAPEVEAAMNKTAFGGKIYDDIMFKPESVRENIPAYRKATSKTGKVYVEMSELLNAISGGDEVQKGAVNINPAVVEHLVEGHLGGMYDLAKMVVSLPMSILRGEDVELRDIPFVNKVVMSADETNMHSRVNEAFYFYQDIATNAKRVEKEYRDLGMSEKAASYRMTDDWRIHMLFNQYEPDLKEYKDKLKDVTDEGEKDLLLDGQNVIREQLINDIASGKGPDPVTEIRLGIKSIEEEVKRTTKPYKDADKRVKEARERKDYEAKAKAQKERDSIKRTDEYKSAKIMEKEIKELKKRLDGLGSESSPAQRDSVIGEIERDYEALIGKIMRSSSE